jgi:hypothetical protein
MLRFQSPPLSVSQKVPKSEHPPGPQRRPLWRELPVSRTFSNISLKFLIKFLLIKEILPLSRRNVHHVPQKGPLWKQTPIYRAVLSIFFGVPSKGALP